MHYATLGKLWVTQWVTMIAVFIFGASIGFWAELDFPLIPDLLAFFTAAAFWVFTMYHVWRKPPRRKLDA